MLDKTLAREFMPFSVVVWTSFLSLSYPLVYKWAGSLFKWVLGWLTCTYQVSLQPRVVDKVINLFSGLKKKHLTFPPSVSGFYWHFHNMRRSSGPGVNCWIWTLGCMSKQEMNATRSSEPKSTSNWDVIRGACAPALSCQRSVIF